MHWFWRAAIAVVVGCVFAFVSVMTPAVHLNQNRLQSVVEQTLGCGNRLLRTWQVGLGVSVAHYLPCILLAVAVYILLTRVTRGALEHETRCRKCGYILRGISEPRCPECGERI